MPFTPKTRTEETDPLGPATNPTTSKWDADEVVDLETRVTDYADIKAPGVSVAEDPYLAIPDGSTSDRSGIQAAIDAVHSAGGGRVFLPWAADPYLVDLVNCPGSTSVAAGLVLYSDVELWSNGATIKLIDDADPGTRTQWHIVGVDTPYTSSALKSNIKVVGNLTIDGNADNQTNLSGKQGMGLFFGATEGFTAAGVKVQNVYGTSNLPPGESFHFEANNCKDGAYLACEADGSGSANTATGFSTDNSFGITWTSCNAHDMGFGQGFTCWQSANLAWEGCRAWSNATSGFNAERSEGLRWSGCHSGGQSPLIGNGDDENPFFPLGQVSLANTTGFSISGCSDAVIGADCSATYNTTNLDIHTNTGGSDPDRACANVVAFGMYRHATGQNVYIEDSNEGGGKLDQSGCMAVGSLDDGVPDAFKHWGHGPFESYRSNGSSGIRFVVDNIARDEDGSLYRWNNKDGDTLLALDRARRLTTVGRVKGYRHVTGNTTISAKDHILGVDSTGGAYTLTLPQFGAVGGQVTVVDGTEYEIADYGNNAATNNITVARAGSDTFVDGSTSKIISTNSGALRIIATNGKWKLVDVADDAKALTNAAYRVVMLGSGRTTTAAGSGTTYALPTTGIDNSTTPYGLNAAPQGFLIRLNSADYAVTGLTTKLRVVADCLIAGTPPAVTATVGLYPLSISGSNIAWGTVVSGSTVAFTTPSANTINAANSGDFSFPANGPYAFGVVLSGTPSATLAYQVRLQVRNV